MWTDEQQGALDKVGAWHANSSQQVFRLFGYAGTGKTTLARHLAEQINGEVQFAAYTGKAAHVLQTKGCPATTIHSLIYHPKNKSRERLIRLRHEMEKEKDPKVLEKLRKEVQAEEEELSRPSFSLNRDSDIKFCKLVVIDECSMVGEQMGKDLESFDVPILVLGDPAQLPPVRSAGYFTNNPPHYMLNEVHRQAKDNPIIRLATQVRNESLLSVGEYGTSRVADPSVRLDADFVLSHDQILVGRNATRVSVNRRVRQLLGRTSALPEQGDKLVCLRNDADAGLLNGSMWTVVDCEGESEEYLSLVVADGKTEVHVRAHKAPFLGQDLNMPWWDRKEAQEFTYGYAITTHKAQGSQWPKVLVFDESRTFRADRYRWLYTAITRAAESVTIIPR